MQFEHGAVRDFELVENMGGGWGSGCSKTGICLFPVGKESSNWGVFSNGEDNKKALRFREVIDRCSIYIYEKQNSIFTNYSVIIGSDQHFPLATGGYVNSVLTPNRYSLVVYHEESKDQLVHQEAELNCLAGKKIYLEITLTGRLRWQQLHLEIEEVDEERGQEFVND